MMPFVPQIKHIAAAEPTTEKSTVDKVLLVTKLSGKNVNNIESSDNIQKNQGQEKNQKDRNKTKLIVCTTGEKL